MSQIPILERTENLKNAERWRCDASRLENNNKLLRTRAHRSWASTSPLAIHKVDGYRCKSVQLCPDKHERSHSRAETQTEWLLATIRRIYRRTRSADRDRIVRRTQRVSPEVFRIVIKSFLISQQISSLKINLWRKPTCRIGMHRTQCTVCQWALLKSHWFVFSSFLFILFRFAGFLFGS